MPSRSDTVFSAPTACSFSRSTIAGITASIAVRHTEPDNPLSATKIAVSTVEETHIALAASPANVSPQTSQVTMTSRQRSDRSASTPAPRKPTRNATDSTAATTLTAGVDPVRA